MTATHPSMLFVALRSRNPDGQIMIEMADVKTGERCIITEERLHSFYKRRLGQFLHFTTEAVEKSANIKIVVEGDVAYATNVAASLVDSNGSMVFKSEFFGNAISSSNKNLPAGEYNVRISLLPVPKRLPSGELIHFKVDNEFRILRIPPEIPVEKEENKIVGRGFTSDKIVIGKGFEVDGPKIFSLHAVVLSTSEKNGWRTHYLWILDRQAEGRFSSKTYKLEIGHFFQGSFTNNKEEKYDCEKYLTPIEKPLVEGGILSHNNKVYFKVRIDQFKPAGGNRRYGSAMAKYFGEIVEGEKGFLKLSADSNGKFVKIQRLGISSKEYAWRVIEIL